MNENMNQTNSKQEHQQYFQSDALKKLLKQNFKMEGAEHYAEEILLEFGNDFVDELISLAIKFAA